MSQADAYRSAYNASKMTNKSIIEKASDLASNVNIKERVKELRDKVARKSIMSAQERLEWLTRLVLSEDATNSDRIKALDIMNKMDGEYTQKIQADVQTETTINIELVEDDEG